MLGGKVDTADVSEYGKTAIEIDDKSLLFKDICQNTICWMSHTDSIKQVPTNFEIIGKTKDLKIKTTPITALFFLAGGMMMAINIP